MSVDGMYRIHDTDSLQMAIRQASVTGEYASNATARRHIMRRARSLGHFDLIPDTWKRINRDSKPEMSEFSDHERSQANKLLQQKAETAKIDISLLRSVYVRGIREFTDLDEAPASLVTRDDWAQARVNSFIRAYNGDPATRSSDYDLLN